MRRLLCLVLACAVPRLLYWLWSPASNTEVYTWSLADSLLSSGTLAYDGVRTAAYEPLYPLWLALTRFVTGDQLWAVVVLQIALACAAAVWLDQLVRHMTGSPRAGLIAAMAYAASPYLIRQASGWLEITLLNALLCAAWLAWVTQRTATATACLALAALTRAIVWPVALAAVALTLVRHRREGLIAAAVAALILGPWAVRNTLVGGTPWPSRHDQMFYAGNNPHTAALVPRHDMDLFHEVSPTLVPGGDFLGAAMHYLRHSPGHALWTKARNFAYFFSPRLIPYDAADETSELVIAESGQITTLRPRERGRWAVRAQETFAGLVLAFGLFGMVSRRHRWREDVLLVVTMATIVCAATIYYPSTRLRTAVDPILMAWGAAVVARRRSSTAVHPGDTR